MSIKQQKHQQDFGGFPWHRRWTRYNSHPIRCVTHIQNGFKYWHFAFLARTRTSRTYPYITVQYTQPPPPPLSLCTLDLPPLRWCVREHFVICHVYLFSFWQISRSIAKNTCSIMYYYSVCVDTPTCKRRQTDIYTHENIGHTRTIIICICLLWFSIRIGYALSSQIHHQ